jgi:hypothetical protein
MKYFGTFKKDGKYDISIFNEYKNTIPKEKVIDYIKELPYGGVAPGFPIDFITGEDLPIMGFYEDGDFCFPIEFLHYYENYDIGIPYDYEDYLINVKIIDK